MRITSSRMSAIIPKLPAALALLLVFAYQATSFAQGRCRVLCQTTYDEDFFYLAASVQKPAIAGRATDLFGDPMKDDAIAVFLQVENDAAGTQRTARSVEMVASAAGGSQLYRGAAATPLKDFSEFIKVGNVPIPFKSQVTRTGTLNGPGGPDTGYTLEIAIPWAEIGGAPKVGQLMRFNVVALSAAPGTSPILSLSPRVKGAGDLQNPAAWTEIVFVDAPVKSFPSAPAAKVCARVFSNKPLVDGTITEGEWNSLTAFGFSEAPSGGGAATFNPVAATARTRPAVTLQPAPAPVTLPAPVVKALPAHTAQSIPRLTFARYDYDFQNDPRKTAPLLSTRREDGASLLASHPSSGEGPWMTHDRVDWHRHQLQEMKPAGIDVVLPVFNADSASRARYARRGLLAMVSALKAIRRNGRDYPLIAMYLETQPLSREKLDLKETSAQARLYAGIRDFYLCVPQSLRLSIALEPKNGGMPANLVVISSAAAFADVDASFVDYCRARYSADFGADLIVLGGTDFRAKAKLDGYVDSARGRAFQMDAAGWIKPASLGLPSFDAEKAALAAGGDPVDTYRNDWRQAVNKQADWVFVDGWNDFVSGSAIASSMEHGVQLSDLTKAATRILGGDDPSRAAFISNTIPSTAFAGSKIASTIRVGNAGSVVWEPDTHVVAYEWQPKNGGQAAVARTVPVPSEIIPGASVTIPFDLSVPGATGEYNLAVRLAKVDRKPGKTDDSARVVNGSQPLTVPVNVSRADDKSILEYAARVMDCDLPTALESGGSYSAIVVLRNDGSRTWKSSSGIRVRARLWKYSSAAESMELVPMADASAALNADIPPGQNVSLTVPVTFAESDGKPFPVSFRAEDYTYQIRWEIAEGNSGTMTAPETIELIDADVGAVFTHDLTPNQLPAERRQPVRLGVRNAGPQTWRREGTRLGYHWYYLDGVEAVWEDETTPLPQDVEPGKEIEDILAWVTAPPGDGRYWLVWDVKVGDTWASTLPSVRPHETQVDMVEVINGKLTMVDLSKAFNLDGVSTDSDRADGDLDGTGRTFPAELMPPLASTDEVPSTMWLPSKGVGLDSSRRLTFKWGPKGDKESNFVQCVGQKVLLYATPAKMQSCTAVHLVAAATRDGATGAFTLQFADGTQQFTSFPVSKWDAPPTRGEEVVFGCRRSHSKSGEVHDKPIALYRYTIKVTESKKVAAILLPNAPDIKIAAITLEK